MKIAGRHRFGDKNFEVASRFLENLCQISLRQYSVRLESVQKMNQHRDLWMALRIMKLEHSSKLYSNMTRNEIISKLKLYETDTQNIIVYKELMNPLKTKRRPLYLKTQPVPRCEHFSSRL